MHNTNSQHSKAYSNTNMYRYITSMTLSFNTICYREYGTSGEFIAL